MNTRITPKLITTSLALLSCLAGTQVREVLFLCDLSKSTANAEQDMDEVLRLAIKDAPDGAAFRVYPVHGQTKTAGELIHGELQPARSRPLASEARLAYYRALTEQLKKARADDRGGQREHSCIVDGLARASEFAKLAAERNHEFTVVFLSDMIEDCGPLPAVHKGRITDLAEAILNRQFGTGYQKEITLPKARILICQPAAGPSGNLPDNSQFAKFSLVDQKQFWETILQKTDPAGEIKFFPSADECANAVWK